MNKQQKLSPEKYIITKAKSLPFHECFINEDWETDGMASIAISKKMPLGKLILGMYMVDVFCMGLKSTLYKFALYSLEYADILVEMNQRQPIIECNLTHAHNIIYGAIDYAEELGFNPHKDFSITEYLLDADLITEGINEIEFGKDGKPYYFAGPYDDSDRILGILEKNVGKGNFDFITF